MTFGDALNQIISVTPATGNAPAVRRAAWARPDAGVWAPRAIMVGSPTGLLPYLVADTQDDNGYPWTPSALDLFARDWELVP